MTPIKISLCIFQIFYLWINDWTYLIKKFKNHSGIQPNDKKQGEKITKDEKEHLQNGNEFRFISSFPQNMYVANLKCGLFPVIIWNNVSWLTIQEHATSIVSILKKRPRNRKCTIVMENTKWVARTFPYFKLIKGTL